MAIPNNVTRQEIDEAYKAINYDADNDPRHAEFVNSIKNSLIERIKEHFDFDFHPSTYFGVGFELGMKVAENRCLNAVSQSGESLSAQTLDNDTESVVS